MTANKAEPIRYSGSFLPEEFEALESLAAKHGVNKTRLLKLAIALPEDEVGELIARADAELKRRKRERLDKNKETREKAKTIPIDKLKRAIAMIEAEEKEAK